MPLTASQSAVEALDESERRSYASAATMATSQQQVFRTRPVYLLTIGLLGTYGRINENYYETKRRKQQQQQQAEAASSGTAAGSSAAVVSNTAHNNTGGGEDNADYKIVAGEKIHERYTVIKRLGKGSFGQVVLARDDKTNQDVAIKIIKSKKPFTRQADTEIRLLNLLNGSDAPGSSYVVKLLETFMHQEHRCLVFEKLSINLYDLLRNTKFTGISLELIRKFAKQILAALKFFASPGIGVIHCDLKPENILLVQDKRSALKVIDFGSSCTINDRPFLYIQSRFYRSPEVMLGCQYSTAIDMWSLGCILIEMHTGIPLYGGQNEHEQLYLLVNSRGLPPDDMLREGRKVSNFFDSYEVPDAGRREYKLKDLPASSQASASKRLLTPLSVEQSLGIADNSPENAPFKRPAKERQRRENRERYEEFADFLKGMLHYSPVHRIRPEDALNHPFLQHLPAEAPNQPSSATGGNSYASATSARRG